MFQLVTDLVKFKAIRTQYKKEEIGFVPTMGNLHRGHLSLIKRSIKQNEVTIITIFVNPTQFGPREDFNNYPRTIEQDIELIKAIKTQKTIILFTPNKTDIYPENFTTRITIQGQLRNIMCDRDRPDHFNGVTTVIYLLLNIIKPAHSYFGEKDYQQLLLIKKMVQDLSLNTIIYSCPTIRETDGLAISSRNQHLSTDQRKQALKLYLTLQQLKKVFFASELTQLIFTRDQLLKNDNYFTYLEILDATTLQTTSSQTEYIIISGSYHLGTTRLIDNITFKLDNNTNG